MSCGHGVEIRKRTCTAPCPSVYGLQCEGDDMETRPCDDSPQCLICPYKNSHTSKMCHNFV